ncbi:hypothetical protein [Tellurirhabdus rosea]|uniref:hypothetical protein n=1 Tax=Tellurirhabdus rosea TaxID=2674997 RepID=UPI00225B3598|nr:hypothetical protein [Tellurirhabdus rosea]
MDSNPTQDLINNTVSALNDGGVTSIVPTDGPLLIDYWIDVLAEAPQSQQLRISLQELRSQLESGNPDAVTVRTIMLDMSDQLSVVAQNSQPDIRDQLRPLAEAVHVFAISL